MIKIEEAASQCRSNEAYCEDYDIVDGHVCSLDWPLADISDSTHLHLVATHILYCVIRMLRPTNGWSWSDAISNLSSRGTPVASGYCRGQEIPRTKRG
ncbi:unnamed protein product [Ilex paraguariensis]|uniref:Uncharacterized protein n=1 Tax=Ilex paraguariensis TaxID=185542 RepID=A0ABC8R7F7_9AQUA